MKLDKGVVERRIDLIATKGWSSLPAQTSAIANGHDFRQRRQCAICWRPETLPLLA